MNQHDVQLRDRTERMRVLQMRWVDETGQSANWLHLRLAEAFGFRSPNSARKWIVGDPDRMPELRTDRQLCVVLCKLISADPVWFGVQTVPYTNDLRQMVKTINMQAKRSSTWIDVHAGQKPARAA